MAPNNRQFGIQSIIDARSSAPLQLRPAFSLIELLVVITILALLLAILLPSLGKARDQAKRMGCGANLHQLAVGWHLYLDANKGQFLQGNNAELNYGGAQGSAPIYGGPANAPIPISKPLNAYLNLPLITIEGAEAFRCPADKGGGIAPETCFAYYGTSYITNIMLIGQDQVFAPAYGPCKQVMVQANRQLPGVSDSRVNNPGRLILMGDFGWLNSWFPGNPHRIEWHRKRSTHNIVFLDGHVEFVRIRSGLHVTPTYIVMPFENLIDDVRACQQENLGE